MRIRLDRRGMEESKLELRRLARRYGLEVKVAEIKKVKAKG